jgi:hypothetical protein
MFDPRFPHGIRRRRPLLVVKKECHVRGSRGPTEGKYRGNTVLPGGGRAIACGFMHGDGTQSR